MHHIFPSLPRSENDLVAWGIHETACYISTLPNTCKSNEPTLLLAWVLTVSQYTASPETLFGLATSGRNAPMENNSAFPCPPSTTVPFWIKVIAHQKVTEALSGICFKQIRMIPFQHAGHQKIRKYNTDTAAGCDLQSVFPLIPAVREDLGSLFRHPVRQFCSTPHFGIIL
jgi:hypothetical protein